MSKTLVTTLVLCALIAGCSKKGGGPTQPTGPGSVQIVTVPGSATASVIVSGATASAFTPTRFDGVDAGPAAVDLRLEGYADTTVVLNVSSGGTVVDTVSLRPLAGTPTSITELWAGSFTYVGPIAVSPSGTFYVTAHTGTINVLAVVNSAGAILHQSVIPDPDANPAFDIALDASDNAYVATKSYGNTIFVFNASGSFVRSFGRRDPAGSDGLAGIAIGPGDTVHVSARYGGTPVVEKYSSSGVFADALTTGASSAGPLEVGTDGSVYVGNAGAELRKFSRTGTPQGTWTLAAPAAAITRGPGGKLYVSSFAGGGVPVSTPKAPNRIEVFTSAGVRQAVWGTENRGLPYLDRHAVDAQGNIILPLRNDRVVLKYTTN